MWNFKFIRKKKQIQLIESEKQLIEISQRKSSFKKLINWTANTINWKHQTGTKNRKQFVNQANQSIAEKHETTEVGKIINWSRKTIYW